MPEFTPGAALAGGALIGLATCVLLIANGRFAGVSGIVHGAWTRVPGDRAWRLFFAAGLVLGAALWAAFAPPTAPARTGFPPALLVVAGLLAGWGTAQARGCTSGHGVCGLARLSARSLAATGTFLAVAIATTFVSRHVFHVG